jgi:4-amino-4-deoxychorismate lyase
MNYIGVNGTVVPAATAMVSVMDHGFLYGMGLFETFRTYGGHSFLLDEHLDRLRNGCRMIGVQASLEFSRIQRMIRDLMEANDLSDAYIRYTVTAGEAPLGLPSGPYQDATEVIYVKALPPVPDTLYTTGKALYTLVTPRNTPEGPVRLKSLHYMNNIIAKQELMAVEHSAGSTANPEGLPSEGLMLTANGLLAEGLISNLFFIHEGEMFTPSVDTGILPGITRRKVLQLAQRMGLKTEEGAFGQESLFAADEIFLTNSIQELVPVTRLISRQGVGQDVGNGQAGPLTRQLLKAYRDQTGGYRE